jgi:cell division protein FtsL
MHLAVRRVSRVKAKTMAIIVAAAAVVTIAAGVGGFIRWIYRQWQGWVRVKAEIEDLKTQIEDLKAEIKDLEARVTEMQIELNSIRPRRPRVSSRT